MSECKTNHYTVTSHSFEHAHVDLGADINISLKVVVLGKLRLFCCARFQQQREARRLFQDSNKSLDLVKNLHLVVLVDHYQASSLLEVS